MGKYEIKGPVTDVRKSVHVPDFKSHSVKIVLRQIKFMNNSGYSLLKTELSTKGFFQVINHAAFFPCTAPAQGY